jgi:hypothetical protein
MNAASIAAVPSHREQVVTSTTRSVDGTQSLKAETGNAVA